MDKKKKDLEVFGFGMAIILMGFAVVSRIKHGELTTTGLVLVCVSLVFAFVTKLNYKYLVVIYKPWMKGAHFIGTVISTVTLALCFYLLFAPIGILFRIIKKDYLDKELQPEAASYWHAHQKKKFDPKRYLKQF